MVKGWERINYESAPKSKQITTTLPISLLRDMMVSDGTLQTWAAAQRLHRYRKRRHRERKLSSICDLHGCQTQTSLYCVGLSSCRWLSLLSSLSEEPSQSPNLSGADQLGIYSPDSHPDETHIKCVSPPPHPSSPSPPPSPGCHFNLHFFKRLSVPHLSPS